MTGLLLLAVVGLWLWLCVAIARRLMRNARAQSWRYMVGPSVFVVLLVAPVADEIVGGAQFRDMCAQEAVLTIDAAKVRGRTIKRAWTESYPADTVLRIRRVQYQLVDVSSGEQMGRYVTFSVWGGWLIRTLGISEGDSPLLINPASCDPIRNSMFDREYGFVLSDI